MTSVYDMAKKYYPTYWNKNRLIILVEANKLTPEEYEKVTGEPYSSEN